MYIDVHTHVKRPCTDQGVDILALSVEEETSSGTLYTAGVHPWNVAEVDFEAVHRLLDNHAQSACFVGVGEIGLDRARPEYWDKQLLFFEHQLKWAQSNAKPVVLHCVRSYYDVIAVVKKARATVPLIFHGYRGNEQVTRALLAYNSYFSFGLRELSPEKMNAVPLSRMFFETDGNADIQIDRVYEDAGKILNVPADKMASQIWGNAETVFGRQVSNLR